MDFFTHLLTCVLMTLLQGVQLSQSQYDTYWDPHKLSPEELLPPSFRNTTNKTEVRQGEKAVLRCAIDNLGTKKVTWRRKSEYSPMFIGTRSFSSDKRYRVEHEPLQPDWNLIIEQANPSDEGLYVCQISSRETMLKYVFLKVQRGYVSNADRNRKISGRSHSDRGEIKPGLQISKDQILDKGKKLLLYCSEVTGKNDMADSIDWFFDGNILTSDKSKEMVIKKQIAMMKRNISSTLEVESVKMSDAGVYICRTSTGRIGKVRVDVLNADSRNSKRGTERNSNQGRYAIARHNRYDAIDDEEGGTDEENGCSESLFRPVTLCFAIFVTCLLHRFMIS